MRTTTNPRTASIKVCMDYITKIRLVTCAQEQHKTVSQLVTDWIWSYPIKADIERREGTE